MAKGWTSKTLPEGKSIEQFEAEEEEKRKQSFINGERFTAREVAEGSTSNPDQAKENLNRPIRDTIEAMKAKKKAGLK